MKTFKNSFHCLETFERNLDGRIYKLEQLTDRIRNIYKIKLTVDSTVEMFKEFSTEDELYAVFNELNDKYFRVSSPDDLIIKDKGYAPEIVKQVDINGETYILATLEYIVRYPYFIIKKTGDKYETIKHTRFRKQALELWSTLTNNNN